MRNSSVWERACGLTRTVVEDVDFDDAADAIVVAVRPVARARSRWRALDLGTTKVFVEADAPRVRCRAHGVTVAVMVAFSRIRPALAQ